MAEVRDPWDVGRAVRHARRFAQTAERPVIVCWDLDNTLVASGLCLRAGLSLSEAIVEAYPVPNMLRFYMEMRRSLDGAGHYVLSARSRDMRQATHEWIGRHLSEVEPTSVSLVPRADAKPRIWHELARGRKLVIVDDLSFNHEHDVPDVYEELVRDAREVAASYVGVEEIDRIAADPEVIGQTVDHVARACAAAGPWV